MNSHTWSDWSCAVTVTTLDDRDLDPAVRTVRAVMTEVERSASRFHSGSDLSRINADAGAFVLVSPLTLALVGLAVDVAERTSGSVTPTVGSALLALGYDDDIAVVAGRLEPNESAPAQCRPAPTVADCVRLDPNLSRVRVAQGTRLDLGALGKAYAVDEAVRRVAGWARAGVLVSIGGDLVVHSGPEDGWTIAVCETAGHVDEHVTIDTGALVTSSTTGRRWGAGHHHIVDPCTGRSADGPWRTATVWAPSAVEANVLSTWCLVDAPTAEQALAEGAHPARLVTTGGTVDRRHGWPAAEEPAA